MESSSTFASAQGGLQVTGSGVESKQQGPRNEAGSKQNQLLGSLAIRFLDHPKNCADVQRVATQTRSIEFVPFALTKELSKQVPMLVPTALNASSSSFLWSPTLPKKEPVAEPVDAPPKEAALQRRCPAHRRLEREHPATPLGGRSAGGSATAEPKR